MSDLQLFPSELKALPQWCVATLNPGDGGDQDKAPYDAKTGKRASVNDPSTWSTFEQALATRQRWRETSAPNAEVGFVFAASDPFAVIDLDTYKAEADITRKLHSEVLRKAGTYSELSQSGLGTHIIGHGTLPTGIHNTPNSLEAYSSGRFMICTGRPVDGQALPLVSIQDLLDDIHDLHTRGGSAANLDWRNLGDGEESHLSDAELVDIISGAENGDKFDRLCNGDLSDFAGDRSSADAALIEFLCWYTPDNQQVRRIFMLSKLADREKAHRPDYIPRTIAAMRKRIADDKIPDVNADAIADRARAVAAQAYQELHAPPPVVAESVEDDGETGIAPVAPLSFPPGLVGEIARYVMATSPRPVEEIAIATGIAVVAGIVGRNYNISNTGLNQYILVLGKTGTGKEAAQSSTDRLFTEVQKNVPTAERFLGPAHFSSGPALVKQFQERPCFMSVLGEFGHRLKAMTHPRANGAEKTLMAAMLDIYGKSGWAQMLRASVYSDKEKNTQLVHAPAMTILAETEPDGFFANLDESVIASGFLPRFLVVEYRGDRPSRNKNAWVAPPAELVTKVGDLCTTVVNMEQKGVCTVVPTDPAAQKLLDIFDEWVDDQMRGSNLVTRELWNRTHLKALRLSALLAVGVNPYDAKVTYQEAKWAIDMVRRDAATILERFERGDVGEGDTKLLADITVVIRRYLAAPGDNWDAYHAKGCIPLRLLQQRTGNRTAFKNHKLGANRALKDTLATMVETGLLVQVSKQQAKEWFGTSSVVYALGDHWDQ